MNANDCARNVRSPNRTQLKFWYALSVIRTGRLVVLRAQRPVMQLIRFVLLRMRTGRHLVLPSVACLIAASCTSTEHQQRCGAAAPVFWPQELAGRRLQVLTSGYVLYGNDDGGAAELARWVDNELSAIQCRYGITPGQGLVLAIDSAEDPLAPLEMWRADAISRKREIHWTSQRWKQPEFRSAEGRPYCLGYGAPPYFTESYVIPLSVCRDLRIPPNGLSSPDWACALATDSYFLSAYDAELAARRRTTTEERRMRQDKSLGDLMMDALWACGRGLIAADYQHIDLDLMRLQRREVLCRTVIEKRFTNEKERAAVLASLLEETDQAWQKLYFDRMID